MHKPTDAVAAPRQRTSRARRMSARQRLEELADIIGGEVIPNIHKERSGDKMTVPGEILLIDSDGNLLVQDEAEDVEDFRRYVRPAEEMKPAASDDPALMDPMSDTALPGEDPGGDMGPRRRRRGMP